MITWSEEELSTIFSSDKFNAEYKVYFEKNKDLKEFKQFLDNIQLNKKYFRLTTNNKIGQNKRFKNKNVSQDTISIKEINSYLNKLTDRNISHITQEIQTRIVGRDHLKQMIMQSIIEKCIVQPNYNTYYLEILFEIYKNTENLKDTIESIVNDNYSKIINKNINTEQSEYLQFCDKNKNLDLIIGHSQLITELEKMKIIHNKINPLLNELLKIISESSDYEEKNKCVQCLYSIFKSFYGDSLLPQGFIDTINTIKEKETTMKIKFKLMDILERK